MGGSRIPGQNWVNDGTRNSSPQINSQSVVQTAGSDAGTLLPLLMRGSLGEPVRKVQSLLNADSDPAPGLKCDGVFGPKTEAAVVKFQRKNSIKPDGIVGKQTWHYLLTKQIVAGIAGTGETDAAVVPATPTTQPRPTPVTPAKTTPASNKKVLEIKALLSGTKSRRDPLNKTLPDNILRGSKADSKDFSKNPPVYLIRGGGLIELTAVTSPENQGVKWSVESNVHTTSTSNLPNITPNGSGEKAKLYTDQHGAFSIVADLDGNKIAWNVVFVSVVLQGPAKVTPKPNFINKTQPEWDMISCCSSGNFSIGNSAWNAEVTVKIKGGGKDESLGVDKIHLQYLQNVEKDETYGEYLNQDDIESNKGPKFAKPVIRNSTPLVDCNPRTPSGYNGPKYNLAQTGVEQTPFIFDKDQFEIKDGQGKNEKILYLGDSPGADFPRIINNRLLRHIRGDEYFKSAIASWCDEAKNCIVVHAFARWRVNYTGRIDYSDESKVAIGEYKPQVTDVMPLGNFQEIQVEAWHGGFEIFQPRAIDTPNNGWDYTDEDGTRQIRMTKK
jgi:peptidoglycan hydrolase-like protein with peptidoglycan-binding domain